MDNKGLVELRALLAEARALYDGDGSVSLIFDNEISLSVRKKESEKNSALETNDKIRLLELIGDLEDKIRGEEYKERVMNGEE